MECACCGEDRDPGTMASLRCRDDIRICRGCLAWLMQRAGGVDVTPTLPVGDMAAAVRFFEAAGFDVRRYDEGFAFVTLGGQSAFDLGRFEQLDPATNGAGCYLITHDVDPWHERLASAGLDVTPIADMPWGMHEFTLTDPNGNRIRIGRASD